MDLNGIASEFLKIYDHLTLIDIGVDKVTSFGVKEGLIEETTNSYEEYYNALKRVIHPDYINKYFDAISLNGLKENEITNVYYLKLSENLSYDGYTDYIKLIGDNKILLASVKTQKQSNKDNVTTSNNDFVDLIINIENAISGVKLENSESKPVLNYILELTKDVLKQNLDLEKDYKNRVKFNTSTVNESLLIIDDDNMSRNIFKKVFEGSYDIIEAANGEEAVQIIENNIVNHTSNNPKNIVGMFLDLKMPVMDGFGVLDYLNEKRIISRVPVIIISADDAKETKEQVYAYDIADMIEKPFNYELIKKRVKNMTRMYVKNNMLNEVIRVQEKDLRCVIKSYLKGYLENYSDINKKVAYYYEKLINKYNEINNLHLDVNKLVNASKYYDLGLDFIPRKYLVNLNTINETEKNIVFNYPINGSNIIKCILDNESDSLVQYASNICLMHNERFDGKGFPKGIKETQIPDYVYLFNIALELATSKSDIASTIKAIKQKANLKYDSKSIEAFNQIDFKE